MQRRLLASTLMVQMANTRWRGLGGTLGSSGCRGKQVIIQRTEGKRGGEGRRGVIQTMCHVLEPPMCHVSHAGRRLRHRELPLDVKRGWGKNLPSTFPISSFSHLPRLPLSSTATPALPPQTSPPTCPPVPQMPGVHPGEEKSPFFRTIIPAPPSVEQQNLDPGGKEELVDLVYSVPPESLGTREAALGVGPGRGMLAFFPDHQPVPLPPGHRFPMNKYRRMRSQLLLDDSLNHSLAMHPAPFVSKTELLRVHCPEYLRKIENGGLTTLEERAIGFPWSQASVNRARASCGGTVAATHAVLLGRWKAAGTMAGGTHHAFRDHGEGFCIYNDIAVASAMALEEYPSICNKARPILVLDLDVHQGNGTASIFEGSDTVITFSSHGANNYPWRSKMKSTYDVELQDNTGDEEFLGMLKDWLPMLFRRHNPGLVFFQAGVDALKEDSFGRLSLSHTGLLRRNHMVYSQCIESGVPLVITMGGGYSRPPDASIRAHADVYRSAAYRFSVV